MKKETIKQVIREWQFSVPRDLLRRELSIPLDSGKISWEKGVQGSRGQVLGIDRAALLIWEVKPNPSFLGNIFVSLEPLNPGTLEPYFYSLESLNP